MFSNLASYIFGASEEVTEGESTSRPGTPSLTRKKSNSCTSSSPTKEEGEWVLVGDPSNLTLGSLNDQGSLPPAGSSAATSITPSEIGDEDNPEQAPTSSITRSSRRLTTPFSQSTATTLTQMKGVRSAQNAMQKKTHKVSSAKNLDRKNKAVKSSNSKKQFRFIPLRSSGIKKQLKQC